MSDCYRNGAFALGVVVGGGITLNLFLWLDYLSLQKHDPATGADEQSNLSVIGSAWDRSLEAFVTPADTLAQWIVTLLTFAAVILVWRTLVATREMVTETRRMASDTRKFGDAQVKSSIDAVQAAQEANEVASKQFYSGFKPWITVELSGTFIENKKDLLDPDWKQGERREIKMRVQVKVTSIGDIPASVDDLSVCLLVDESRGYIDVPPPEWLHGGQKWLTVLQRGEFAVLEPGFGPQISPLGRLLGTAHLTEENQYHFIGNPPPVIGFVDYYDPLGNTYRHHFAFVLNSAMSNNFQRFGGRERNFEEEFS